MLPGQTRTPLGVGGVSGPSWRPVAVRASRGRLSKSYRQRLLFLLPTAMGFDSRTGKQLYQFNTSGSISGGVIPYAINGKQYIAVNSGSTSLMFKGMGASTFVIFALPD